MSKSIRVTITRPDLTIDWPFGPFTTQGNAHSDAYLVHPVENHSYIIGADGLTCIVDHDFPNGADLDANREEFYSMIPWWRSTSNAAEVDAYTSANNITVEITEVEDPAHTGWLDITNLSSM